MINVPPFFLRRVWLLFLGALAWPACAAEQPRRVAGFIERVVVGKPGTAFEAKLDTGADLSSIDATEIKESRRRGQTWIGFTVVRVDGRRVKLSGRLVRYATIKRAGSTTERPVLLLDICLGPVSRTVEVSLADRHGLDYDVLVGRNFLNGYFMVDPARDHALTPSCPVRGAK